MTPYFSAYKLVKKEYFAQSDDDECKDDHDTDNPSLGKDLRVILYVFWRDRCRYFLLGAANGAHEDAVTQFGSAGWANHGINSYSLFTIDVSILYVKKLYFNNINGIYNNLHNSVDGDILLII